MRKIVFGIGRSYWAALFAEFLEEIFDRCSGGYHISPELRFC